MPILVSYSTQIRLMPSSTLARPEKLAMSQQSPRLPCLTSDPLILSMNLGVSKISWTRLTAFGTVALGLSIVVALRSNFVRPRLFKQWPFSILRSQSWR